MERGTLGQEEQALDVDGSLTSHYVQRATFVICSETLSPDQIATIVGYSGDFTLSKGAIRQAAVARVPAKYSSWEIREQADSVADALALIFGRLRPIRDEIRQLCDLGCPTRLSVLQWASPGVNLGFAIDADDLRMLASFGAFIDIDQYISA